MALLPINTSLGQIRLVEVFAEHDFPVVFACQSDDGRTYIATWLSEVADSTGWLYVPVSPGRLGSVRAARVSLRDAFAKSETGQVYNVTVPKRAGAASATAVPTNTLTDDMLPTADAFVDESEIIDDAAADALLKSKDDAELSIDGRPVEGDAVEAGFFGSFLRAVQDLATAFHAAVVPSRAARDSNRQQSRNASKLVVPAGFVPGSFTLRLRLPTEAEPLFQPAPGTGILEFVSQVLTEDTISKEAAFYAGLPRVRAQVYRTLSLVAKQRASVHFRTRGNPFGVELTAQAARERMAAFAKVTTSDQLVVGLFQGGSLETPRFELRVGTALYKGRSTERSKRQSKGIALGDRVEASLRIRVTTDVETGSVRIKTQLLSIKKTDDPLDRGLDLGPSPDTRVDAAGPASTGPVGIPLATSAADFDAGVAAADLASGPPAPVPQADMSGQGQPSRTPNSTTNTTDAE